VLTAVGGTIGGSLVFDHGFNVETAGDSPTWHRSERDLRPDEEAAAADGGRAATVPTDGARASTRVD
jgi:hypothetical protein